MDALSQMTSQQYLPVQIGHQRFLLPLVSVVAIHQRKQQNVFENSVSDGAMLRAVDMSKLFWDNKVMAGSGYALTLSNASRICALVVDNIYPAITLASDEYQALPDLLKHLSQLFNGIYYGETEAHLLIDSDYIIGLINSLYPEYILEPDYVT